MKKVLVFAVVILFVSNVAFAAGQARKNTGCGLGTMIWKENSDDRWLFQAFQATTNGTSGNQTFGITTGTSECDRATKVVQNERLNQFVADNMDNLAKDIAQGNGESLDTLAELMEIPATQRLMFNAKLQSNFPQIFTSEKIEAADVIDNIVTITTLQG